MAVLFISEDYYKAKSVISKNVDYNLIVPIVEVVQDLEIKPLLGHDLFELIKTQISSNTLSAVNQTLLDTYILKIMVCYITARASNVLKFRFTNKGMLENSGDNSQVTDNDNIERIYDAYRHDGEAYADEMIKYLQSEILSYPAYLTNAKYYKQKPTDAAYQVGIYLP